METLCKGKPRLLIIAGPTAVGKTEIGVELALRIGGEVVSADSMLVYRGMDIGTAKPTAEERRGVVHHLIDILEPHESYSAASFVMMARSCIADITGRGKLPILVGGTGFYIKSLVYDNAFMLNDDDVPDPKLRKNLLEFSEVEGVGALHKLLVEADPAAASRIHPNNVKRVVRALEYNYVMGTKFSDRLPEVGDKPTSPYDMSFYVISSRDRGFLYERINRRVEAMLEAGLVEEVRGLLERVPHDAISMQGVGYKELVPHILGGVPLQHAVELVKQNTRKFAKRQLTWFRNQISLNYSWKHIDEYGKKCIIDSITLDMRGRP